MLNKRMHLVGYHFGLAGADPKSADGPVYLQRSRYLSALSNFCWEEMISCRQQHSTVQDAVCEACLALARKISDLIRKNERFSVIGGDHTSALGTWSGVYDALHPKGDIGLLWIDAHMDSHTPDTTESGRIHGMPLACLLGHGFPSLTNLLHAEPKLKPENVCLIGIRSYESGEAALLKRLKVRVYFMEEVARRGIEVVLQEAIATIRQRTIGYGLSIDLDVLDPHDAPGVDVPEPNGINAQAFCNAIEAISKDPALIGTEIVEFDPHRDENHKTEKIIVELLKILGAV